MYVHTYLYRPICTLLLCVKYLIINCFICDLSFQEETERILCNMSQTQWNHLSEVLMKDVSSDKIIKKLHLEHVNVTTAQNRVNKFVTNVS